MVKIILCRNRRLLSRTERIMNKNYSNVFRTFSEATGPISAAFIQEKTSLSAATLSRLLNDMISRGMIETNGKAMSKSNRTVSMYCLKADYQHVAGVFIDRDFVNISIADFRGNRIDGKRIKTSGYADDQKILDRIAMTLREIAMELFGEEFTEHIGLIGVCVSGLVQMLGDQVFVMANEIKDIVDIDIKAYLEKAVGISTIVEKDTSACLIYCRNHLHMSDCQNAAFIKFGIGIGAAFMLNGALYKGDFGFSGEICHMIVDGSPQLSVPPTVENTGIGLTALEHLYGMRSLQNKAFHIYTNEKNAYLHRSLQAKGIHSADDIKLSDIDEGARGGDLDCLYLLADYIRNWAAVIINIYCMLYPNVIILGGAVSDDTPFVLAEIIKLVSRVDTFVPRIVTVNAKKMVEAAANCFAVHSLYEHMYMEV